MSVGLLTRGYISDIRRILQQVPLTPTEAQTILVKALELPLSPIMTDTYGIHQSDVIIRSALVAAIADVRAHPFLLDYVFSSLPKDPLTWREYGEKSVDKAKEWFLKTNINVIIAPVMDEIQAPAITISLLESAEVERETTLGDVHSDAFEDDAQTWPTLTRPLTPASYVPGTGVLIFNSVVPTTLEVGQFVIDRVGRAHTIEEVISEYSFRVHAGTVADFRNCIIKPARPPQVVALESSSFKETYRIGVHAPAEPQILTWLHSIVVFCLLRYKQALLEARGFERSTFGSSDFAREEQFESQLVFARYINLSGYVRQYWPKTFSTTTDAVNTTIAVSGADVDMSISGAGENVSDQGWVGNLDVDDEGNLK